MKKILSLLALVIITCTIYLACKKNGNIPVATNNEQQLIANAKTFFENNVQNANESQPTDEASALYFNPVKSLIKNAVWNKAYILKISIGNIVVIPIQFNDSNFYARPANTDNSTRLPINTLSKLIVYTDDAKQMHAEVVTALPDENFIKRSISSFTGIAIVQDWQGNFLRGFHYNSNQVKKIKLNPVPNTIVAPDLVPAPSGNDPCLPVYWYVCVQVGDQDATCGLQSTQPSVASCDDGDGGSAPGPGSAGYGSVAGGGGSSSSASSNFAFLAPKSPVNIAQELKCFVANSSSKYFITVNVNEPSPGTGNVFNTANPHPAGHAYLSFEQDNSDGSQIIRNDGFYPKLTANPGNPITPSEFGDDSNTPASVTLKISVSSQDFMNVVQNVKNQITQHPYYNLEEFNCTTSVLVALQNINIDLPYGIGGMVAPIGGNPEYLGEDIRNLNLNTFSQQNGNRQMVRTVSNANSIYPNSKQGTVIKINFYG